MADPIKRKLPVDGGWAWVVLIGCTCNFAVVVGTLKSFGIFFIEFLVMFDASVSMTSMIAGLMQITYSVVSLPIMTVGLRHLSPRQFILCGSFAATLAYALGSLAPNINFLLFTHGILFGIAFACFHGPSTYVIGQYFEKRRSLANACMAAGGSIGGLVLPSLFQNLLEIYGLRGALLLTAAVMFHITIGAMLLRPPSYYIRSCKNDVHLMEESKSDDPVENSRHQNDVSNNDSCQQSGANIAHFTQINQSSHCGINTKEETVSNGLSTKSHANGNTMDNHVTTSGTSHNSIRSSNVSTFDNPSGTNGFLAVSPELTYHTDSNQRCKERLLFTEDTQILPFNSASKETLKTVGAVRKGQGSQYNLASSYGDLFTNSLTDISQLQASRDLVAQEVTEDPDDTDIERKPCLSIILIDLSLLRNPAMMLFLFSYCLGSIGSVYGHIYILALARDVGINSGQITILVSTLSGCDVIGRITCGAIVDRGLMMSDRVMCLTILTTGTMMLLAHLYHEFWSLLLYSIVHGLFAGGIFALTPAILIDWLGFENFRNAMGLAIFSQGFSLVSSAPFIGFLRDRTYTYISSFLFMGSCMVVAGIVLLLKRIILRLMCKQKNTDQTSYSETS